MEPQRGYIMCPPTGLEARCYVIFIFRVLRERHPLYPSDQWLVTVKRMGGASRLGGLVQ